ncbi:MAG: undecaprenyldiphospho-muramoylpentapeptide beta-N-acetylglucosaminyltransferase [Thermoleophilia bacterium]|nr:undecaprenyldiphospho-muramoylpentapeptide beta-N-acetylglucosaminyltransferase [Thermoleophilia bacterium]
MADERKPRCLIAAGGTAGHVLPALAIADALRERGAHVTFAGSPERAEARLVPEAGYELDTFRVSGLPRRPGVALARSVGRALRAPLACRRILERRRPGVVLGAGSYVGGPMVVAAASLRIPAALTEADAHLGLANRLAAPFARRVFLAFPLEGRADEKYRVTGRPVPARSRAWPREDARRRFGLPEEGRLLLVVGGSQGARALNELAVEAFGERGPLVLHVCGEREHELLRGRVRRDDYVLVPFLDDVGAAYGAADLAVARAGGSVWELAAAGLPAVLVPSPNVTADHQSKNARYFQQAGAAVVVPETDLGRVADLLRSLIDDPRRLEAMSFAMRMIARPDAADEIAEQLLDLAGAERPEGAVERTTA